MKIEEVRKLKIVLSQKEIEALNYAMIIVDNIAEELDYYGFYSDYEEIIENSLRGIQQILDFENNELEKKKEKDKEK